MRIKALAVLGLLIALQPRQVSAYDNENVHPAVNNNALIQSTTDATLKRLLGMGDGIFKALDNGRSIIRVQDAIQNGGIQEDVPDNRSLYHFHDPLKPWQAAGLKGRNVPSVIWAFNHNVLGIEDRSWKKARTTFYEALTVRTIKKREQKFAYALQSLGQLMHLVSDASVPAHVRNDVHVFPYENGVSK